MNHCCVVAWTELHNKVLTEDDSNKILLKELDEYHKKNQVDKLIINMVQTIHEINITIELTSEIINCLAQYFQTLHFETVSKIWTFLNNEIQRCLSLLDWNDVRVGTFLTVSKLTSIFMQSICIDNVPEKPAISLAGSLLETHKLCVHIIDKYSTEKSIVEFILDVLYSCGQLEITLPEECSVLKQFIKKFSPTRDEHYNPSFKSFVDFSPIFYGCQNDIFISLHQSVMEWSNKSVYLNWMKLLLYKLNWIILSMNSSIHDISQERDDLHYSQIKELCDFVFVHCLDFLLNDGANPESVLEFCQSIHLLVKLDHIYSSKSIIIGNDKYFKKFAKSILAILTSKSSSCLESQFIIKSFFVPHSLSSFSTLNDLNAHLLNQILKLISSNFKTICTKNIKNDESSETSIRSYQQIFQSLLKLNENCGENNTTLLAVIFDNLEASINDNVSQLKTCLKPSSCTPMNDIDYSIQFNESILNLLKILDFNLLSYLTVSDKFRCSISSIVFVLYSLNMIIQNPTQFLSQEKRNLLFINLRILKAIFANNASLTLLLKAIDSSLFTYWFYSICNYLTSHYQKDKELIKECQIILNLFITSVFNNGREIQKFMPIIDMLTNDLKKFHKPSLKNRIKCYKFSINFQHAIQLSDKVEKALHRHYIRPELLVAFELLKGELLKLIENASELFCQSFKSSFMDKNETMENVFVDFTDIESLSLSYHLDAVAYLLANNKFHEDEEKNSKFLLLQNRLPLYLKLTGQLIENFDMLDVETIHRCLNFINQLCVQSNSLNFNFNLGEFLILTIGVIAQLFKKFDDNDNTNPLDLSLSSSKYCIGYDSNKFDENISLRYYLTRTASSALATLSGENLTKVVRYFINGMEESKFKVCAESDCFIAIWNELIKKQLSENHGLSIENTIDIIFYHSQQLLFILQIYLQNCSDNVDSVISVMQLLNTFISAGPKFFSGTEVSLILQILSFVNLEACIPIKETSVSGKDIISSNVSERERSESFIKLTCLFNKYHCLLNNMLKYFSETIYNMIPVFLNSVTILLQSIMWSGQQSTEFSIGSNVLSKLDHSAQNFTRLVSFICDEHKQNFAKVIPTLIAQYCDSFQKITLYPRIKYTLSLGIMKCIGICNEFAISRLNRNLLPAPREIFKVTFSEYQKFHKFHPTKI